MKKKDVLYDLRQRLTWIVDPDKVDEIMSIVEDAYDLGVEKGEEESEKEIRRLEREVSDAGWQREYDHADDWRIPHEMCG